MRAITVAGNNLASLAELRVLRHSVQVIDASRNALDYICPTSKDPIRNGWTAKFEQLISLDVSYNSLRQIPDLDMLPALRRLNLKHNDITRLAPLAQAGAALADIDLSENRLAYGSLAEFEKDAANMTGLSASLQTLLLELNPVAREFADYRLVVLRALRLGERVNVARLQLIDGVAVTDAMRARCAPMSATPTTTTTSAAPVAVPAAVTAAAPPPTAAKPGPATQPISGPPTIMTITKAINDVVQGVPGGNAADISRLADALASVPIERRSVFGLDATSKQAQETALLEFTQAVALVGEKQPGARGPVVKALVTLCFIAELEAVCLDQFEQLLAADRRAESVLFQVLQGNLFPRLKRTDLSLIRGLTNVARAQESPAMLRGAVPLLAKWMRRSKEPVAVDVVEMAFVASQDDAIASALATEGIASCVVDELAAQPQIGSPMHLALLGLVATLSKHAHHRGEGSCALLCAKRKLHKTIVDDLNSVLDRRDLRMLFKNDQVVAAHVDAATALLCCEKQCASDLLGAVDSLFLRHLAALFASNRAYSVVAACRAVIACMTLPDEWFPLPSPVARGADKLPDDDRKGKSRRALMEDLASAVLRSGLPLLDLINVESDAFNELWGNVMGGQAAPQSHADIASPGVQRVLIAAIDVVAEIGRQAVLGQPTCAEVASALNDHQREKYLFASLAVPSDIVRLAAVQCLLNVPLDELDADEIAHLMNMLADVTDVSVGRTEEVLASSFEILSKLNASPSKGPEFRAVHGARAVEVCFFVLERNAIRDTGGSESETKEKAVLSEGCVRFLETCSTATRPPLLVDALTSRKCRETMLRVLVCEDSFASSVRVNPRKEAGETARADHYPIRVEDTATGRKADALLEVMRQVSATGPVMPRVMRRLADVLMGLPDAPPGDKVEDPRIQTQARADRERSAAVFVDVAPGNPAEHHAFLQHFGLERVLQVLAQAGFDPSWSEDDVLPPSPPPPPSSSLAQQRGSSMRATTTATAVSGAELLRTQLMKQGCVDEARSLRNLAVALSEAEREVAMRDAALDDAESTEVIAAAVRVLFALLSHGTTATSRHVRRTLRKQANWLVIAQACLGSRQRPNFTRAALGGKLFVVAAMLLELPVIARTEQADEALYRMVMAACDRVMAVVRMRVLLFGDLASDDAAVVAYALRCAVLVARGIEYSNRAGLSYSDLVQPTLLASAIRVLLHAMQASRSLACRPLGEDAGDALCAFLAAALVKSSTYRHAILEELVRSDIVDQFPVRPVLVKELLGRVADEATRAQLEGVIEARPRPRAETWTAPPKPAVVASSVASSSSESSWLSVFSFCTGADRVKPKFSAASAGGDARLPPNGRGGGEDDAWSAVIVPSTTKDPEREWWVADRMGSPRERVVAHAMVDEPAAGKRVLALTGDFVYLLDSQDAPPSLVWKKPYRAVTRAAVFSCVLHLAVVDSDYADAPARTLCLLFASTAALRGVVHALTRLSARWAEADHAMGLALRAPVEVESDRAVVGELEKAMGAPLKAADVARVLDTARGGASFVECVACVAGGWFGYCQVDWADEWAWSSNARAERAELARRYRAANAHVLASMSEADQARGEADYVRREGAQIVFEAVAAVGGATTYALDDVVEAGFVDVVLAGEVVACCSLAFVRMQSTTRTNRVDVTVALRDDATREAWRKVLLPSLGGLKREE